MGALLCCCVDTTGIPGGKHRELPHDLKNNKKKKKISEKKSARTTTEQQYFSSREEQHQKHNSNSRDTKHFHLRDSSISSSNNNNNNNNPSISVTNNDTDVPTNILPPFFPQASNNNINNTNSYGNQLTVPNQNAAAAASTSGASIATQFSTSASVNTNFREQQLQQEEDDLSRSSTPTKSDSYLHSDSTSVSSSKKASLSLSLTEQKYQQQHHTSSSITGATTLTKQYDLQRIEKAIDARPESHYNSILNKEPYPAELAVSRKYTVCCASCCHGITDDVEQFSDDIRESFRHLKEKQIVTIQDWVESVYQSNKHHLQQGEGGRGGNLFVSIPKKLPLREGPPQGAAAPDTVTPR